MEGNNHGWKMEFPRGGITEVIGPHGGGKTELVLRSLAAQSHGRRIAWIEDTLTAYPCAFAQLGVALDRVLFIEASGQSLWATLQVLRSQIFEAVVLSALVPKVLSEVELRRFQIAAEKSNSSLILISEKSMAELSWPISFQLFVDRFETRTLKDRRPVYARRVSISA